MGVHGLWKLLEPTARPVRLEALIGKRLAIDASIWLYQFLKAMKDKDGQVLHGAHIVGFLRRICKLLFFGIKPVFVYDGAPPEMKRRTMNQRKARKNGPEYDHKRMAERLLAAELEGRPMGKKRKTDDLDELPVIDTLQHVWNSNDPRLISEDELRAFVEDNMDVLDLDFQSSAFKSLPIELQHEIIMDQKLKSRQTSWNRLRDMIESAPTALDFSKKQIENLVYRNFMTETMSEFSKNANIVVNPTKSDRKFSGRVESRRIASEKSRQYVLIKNDNDHGPGWKMQLNNLKKENSEKESKISASQNVKTESSIHVPVITIPEETENSDSDEEFMEVTPSLATQTNNAPLFDEFPDEMNDSDEEFMEVAPSFTIQTNNALLFDKCPDELNEPVGGTVKSDSKLSEEQNANESQYQEMVVSSPKKESIPISNTIPPVSPKMNQMNVSPLKESSMSTDIHTQQPTPLSNQPAFLPSPKPTIAEPIASTSKTILSMENLSSPTSFSDPSQLEKTDIVDIEENELFETISNAQPHKKDSTTITADMISETQELLKHFGIPFVIAPSEAEAQCAFFLSKNLVDGIVTDDSDTFLFGGDKVYKNMFNQSKFVEYYVMSDIERQLGLDRQKLIQMAHLLGSDYTPGISGVGIVSSLEILNRFSDLEKFKQWWQSIQSNPTLSIDINDKALKNLCQRIDVPHDFPDPRIRDAYLKPTIDESTESFEWGHADLDALRDYLEERLSWPASKTDQHVLPAIKEMNKRANTQMTLDHFIHIERPIKASQRIQKAVQKMKRL